MVMITSLPMLVYYNYTGLEQFPQNEQVGSI